MNEEFPFQKAHDAIVSMLHDYLAEKEHAERLESENARLKAEVERLTADLPKMVAWGRGLEHDKRLLQEENARLRAAGDQFAKDMVSEYGLKRCKCEDVYINWLAAKGELP